MAARICHLTSSPTLILCMACELNASQVIRLHNLVLVLVPQPDSLSRAAEPSAFAVHTFYAALATRV